MEFTPIPHFKRNIEKAYILSVFFGRELDLTETQIKKIDKALIEYGWQDYSRYKNLNFQNHSHFLKHFETALGISVNLWLSPDNENRVTSVIKQLAECHKKDFDDLTYKYNLMSTMQKYAYKTKQSATALDLEERQQVRLSQRLKDPLAAFAHQKK